MKLYQLAGAALIALHALTATAADEGGRRFGPGGGPGGFNPVIGLFDTDRDGKLNAEEMDKAAAALKALDQNKDGQLTADEIRGGMQPPAGQPRGGEGRGGPRGERESTGQAGGFDKPTVAKDEAEKKILACLDEMRKGPRFANVSPVHGKFLRQVAEALGAKRVVEIGTSTGESGVWFALALRTAGGKLLTHELDPGRAKIARENFNKAGVGDLITIIEGDAHETVKQHKEPIDVLFIDADKEGYIDYLNKLLPVVRPGGVIIAHNISPRMADPRYIEAITASPDLDTSFLFTDQGGMSMSVKKR